MNPKLAYRQTLDVFDKFEQAEFLKPSLATRIFDMAERVDRNVYRDCEAFHAEKSEIVRELKELAMEARG